eukprot:4967265-Prorocentrum_lima.AAC.1
MCIRDRVRELQTVREKQYRSGSRALPINWRTLRVLPCKMVVVRKCLTPEQMKEGGANKIWKAQSSIVDA